MKTWKKLSVMLLTLLLLCSISAPASAADAGGESLELYQGVESFRMDYESDIDMSMSVMGESVDMDIEIEGDIDYILDPEHARMTLDMGIEDTEQESLIYYEKVENGYRMLVSNDDGETWEEQLVDIGDLPAGANLSTELLAKLTDLAKVLPETGDGKVKGTAVTVYSGVLTGKDASDILISSGALSMLENTMDMDLSELNMNDLGSLPVSISIDQKTGYLMQYDLDITEIEQNLMDQLMESLLRGELEGEDLPEDLDLSEYFSVKVNRAVTSTILYDYNRVGEITMPEAAASSPGPETAGDVPFAEAQAFSISEDIHDEIPLPTDYVLADGLTCSNNGGEIFIESVDRSEPDADGFVTVTIRYNKWGVDTITGPKGFEENFGDYDCGYGCPYVFAFNDVTFVDYYTGSILSPQYGWEDEIEQETEIGYAGDTWKIDLRESAENSSYNNWYKGSRATAWMMQWQYDYETVIRMPADYDGLLFGMNTAEVVLDDYGSTWEGNAEDWVFIRLGAEQG